ncbi:MAG: PIN domain-containing protein [Chloroflexota bacterium]|nr:PIN domain-containing protein [Chloroflexota bacterium]
MILLDTSGLLAAIDASQAEHLAAARVLRAATPPLLLSPFVLAELDYLLVTRVGTRAEIALLEEVAAGAYQLEPFNQAGIDAAVEYVRRYKSIELGLADASIIVLADRHSAADVLTLDERHFRTVRRGDGEPFTLLPGPKG